MFDDLVPRSMVAKEFNTSNRSICRWEELKKPGFDQMHFSQAITNEAVKTLGNLLKAEEVA